VSCHLNLRWCPAEDLLKCSIRAAQICLHQQKHLCGPPPSSFCWINYQGDTKARKAQIHSLDFGHETLVTLKGHKGSGRSVNLATAMFQLLCATVLLCLCNADQPQGPTEARHFVAMGIFDMVKWPYVNAKIAVLKVIWDFLVLEAKRNLMNIDLKWIKMSHIAARKDPPAVTFLPYLGP